MFAELIERLRRHEDLTEAQASAAMAAIMRGEAAQAQIAGLLVGLAMKGERPDELVGLATTMREHAMALAREPGAGVRHLRHRRRSLGHLQHLDGRGARRRLVRRSRRQAWQSFRVEPVRQRRRPPGARCRGAVTPAVVARCLVDAGIAFLFAPTFHPAMRHAAQARSDLGVRTAFNLLGPLTNPARPTRQIVGVPRPELTELIARTLLRLGAERAWVVHGADGLDELSTTGHTKVSECRNGAVHTFYVHPADYGLPRPRRRTRRRGCGGQRRHHRRRAGWRAGPARDVVLLNAGAALLVAGGEDTVRAGIARAGRRSIAGRPLDAGPPRAGIARARECRMSGRRPICSRPSSPRHACGSPTPRRWRMRRRSKHGPG